MALYDDLGRVRALMLEHGFLVRPAIEEAAAGDEAKLSRMVAAVGDEFPMTPFTPIPHQLELVERAIARASKVPA